MADGTDRTRAMTAAVDVLTLEERDTIGPGDDVTWHVELDYYSDLETLSQWDQACWDDDAAVWQGPPGTVDIGPAALSVSIGRGRDEPLSRFRPGTATVVVDDPDGKLSPWATASTPDAYAAIRPGIGLRVVAEYAGDRYPRFDGTVSAIVDTFPNISGHAVTFTATDALADLAAYDGTEQPAVGAGETAGPRLARICENAGYSGPTDFQPGLVPLQATTLAQNALNEAGVVTDTELGALFVTTDGVMRFVDRNGLVTNPHYTDVQFVFGEVEPELCYAEVELVTDVARVRNHVSISNAGGSAVTHVDPNSVGLYGSRSYQRFDLIHVDPAESPLIADRYLDIFAGAVQRVEALSILPSVNPETIPAALTLGLLWRIQLRRRAHGFQVVADLQVESIAEEITAREWRVTYRTFTAAGVFAAARWDTAAWDTGLWGY
jgi:hypothetical protein